MEGLTRNSFVNELRELYSPEEIYAMWQWIESEERMPVDLIARLRNKEPVQYIFGYTWFYKRKIIVTRDTLIPRPETEELCHHILADIKHDARKILDVGTGSGCIPVAICAENKNSRFTAIDISDAALKVAIQNASNNKVESLIDFKRCDVLTEFGQLGTDYDVIVSNPPYIALSEKATLADNVLLWEPPAALFPEKSDALVFYRVLATLLKDQKGKCTLYAEINSALADETMDVFSSFENRELLTDWSGNRRFIRIKKEGI